MGKPNKKIPKSQSKSNKTQKRRIIKQSLYKMKGCASKKNRGSALECVKCSKLHKTKQQSGWSCPCECHRKRGQRGGCGCSSGNIQTGGAAVSMSGPFVGSPWRPNVWGWPSVDGISGDRNYLDYNNYHVDPQTQVMPYNFRTGYSGGGVSRRNRRGGWVYKTSTSSNDESKDNEESSDNTDEEKESSTTTTDTKIKKPVGKGIVGKGLKNPSSSSSCLLYTSPSPRD